MKKFFSHIHLWLSVPVGLIISVICFSGALLVFEPEIERSIYADRQYTKNTGTPLPLDSIITIVNATLPDSVTVTGITIYPQHDRTYKVNLSKPRRASIWIDQYSGEIKGSGKRLAFFDTMIRLHRWLLNAPQSKEKGTNIGKLLTGSATFVFVIILISGIIIWFPHTKKALKNSLSIQTGKCWHRFWFGLHEAGGMYAVIILLALSLTGLTWSFKWYNNGFYSIIGAKEEASSSITDKQNSKNTHNPAPRRTHDTAKKADDFTPYKTWDKVYTDLHADNPDRVITISKGSASVMRSEFGNTRAADIYTFNSKTADVTKIIRYEDQNEMTRARGWVYSIHTGAWGGITTRILTCLAALLGGTLPLTGYYLWIRRLIKKRRNRTISSKA